MKAVLKKDFNKARQLMFDENYDSNKEKIEKPIIELQNKMNSRAKAEVEVVRRNSNILFIIVGILLMILIGLIIFTFMVLVKKIGNLAEITNKLKELSNNEGDLTSRIHVNRRDSFFI